MDKFDLDLNLSRATAEENPQSKPATRYLTVFQRKLLQNRLENDLPERYRKRVHIMLLADEGKSQAEICKALDCCHATVRHWILIAQSGQAHTWLDRPMGRPKLIHDDYRNRLKELVEQSPRDYGYAFRRWTAGWLSKHLEQEFNIQVSARHINRLLKQMGLSTRPQPPLKFLEVNPCGEFFWLDLLPGLAISQAIAKHLLNPPKT